MQPRSLHPFKGVQIDFASRIKEIHIKSYNRIKEIDSLIEQKESEIEALRAQIAAMSDKLTADKEQHQEERHFTPEVISEFRTRKKYIDVDLKLLGWTIGDDVREEVELYGMPNNEEKGYADYVLYGRDGLPLAIIEASVPPKKRSEGRNPSG